MDRIQVKDGMEAGGDDELGAVQPQAVRSWRFVMVLARDHSALVPGQAYYSGILSST